MRNKTLQIALVLSLLILSMLLSPVFSSAACTAANTPRIKPVDSFELSEGMLFSYDFNLSNMGEPGVRYTFAPLDKKLPGLMIDDEGVLSFEPGRFDIGASRIAVIAVKDFCADTIIVTLDIFDRPDIVSYQPQNLTFQMNQTESIVFKIRAEDVDENESLIYDWLIDSNITSNITNGSISQSSLNFKPGYKLSGVHDITARVTDSRNLSTNMTWYVLIAKIKRAPVLMFNVPNFMIFKNTAAGAYDLNDYFVDPDGGVLNFGYKQIVPSYELEGVSYANITVRVEKSGFVSYDPAFEAKGYAYFVFTAHDIMNKSTDSNIVRVDIVDSDQFKDINKSSPLDFCGDSACSETETCDTCPYDCGSCENQSQLGCAPEWNCSVWSDCLPAGFQTRNCTDIYNCDDNRTKPDTAISCVYNATCDDRLRNGIEKGVDCGGPCSNCPTCNDSIQNQGEEGVDCGGPCENPCPSCVDELKNQNESDVDCSGQCKPCLGGQSCLKNMDCESLRCDHLVCTYPSCDDSIKNQGEEALDCGGPCPKLCGNCSDGLKNQNEEGVDCGGKCIPCAKCDDDIKNDNEKFVDCGGNCRKCVLGDYLKANLTIIIIIIVIIGIIPLLFISYIFFLFANPDRARALYENNTSFALIVGMNRFFSKIRRLRKKIPLISEETTKRYSAELTQIGSAADGIKPLHQEIMRIYTALLGLPEDFDINIFNMKLRASSIPLFLKILFVGYYHRSEILAISSFVPAEEKLDLIMELKFLLMELGRG
jgi:hypothetical protein